VKLLFQYKIRSLFILLVLLISNEVRSQKKVFPVQGISFEAPRVTIKSETFKPIKELGANWIALMPYGFARKGDPNIQFNRSNQWKGEREEGVIESIKAAKDNHLKIMIKPHLWIHSQFTGHVKFDTESEWEKWENSYLKYILFYAELAQKYDVEMLCIGTELKEFVKARPKFWNTLIQDVRKIYAGKIIYAANWDNYDKIHFWTLIDYIGIDAYFPLSDSKLPLKKELLNAWKSWWSKIEASSKKVKKKIIFTEIGYRSIDYCAKTPWASYENFGKENQQAQYNSLEAFFEIAKNKSFFYGAFLWKWHCKEHMPSIGNEKYTFQNKKAQQLVKSYYD